MATFMMIIAVLATLIGIGVWAISGSAIHEIEAFLLFIIATLGYGFSGLIDQVKRLGSEEKGSP